MSRNLLTVITAVLFAVVANPAVGQMRWLEIQRPGETNPTYQRVQWDSVVAVVLNAGEQTGTMRTAHIYMTEGGKLRMFGTVFDRSDSYQQLRDLVAGQKARWTPALVNRNASPYRNRDAFVDIELAQRLRSERIRDSESIMHDAFVASYGSAVNNQGELHAIFAIVGDDRQKVREQIARSMRP